MKKLTTDPKTDMCHIEDYTALLTAINEIIFLLYVFSVFIHSLMIGFHKNTVFFSNPKLYLTSA